MVYAIDVSLLITGIVVLAIGIIMYAIARYTDGPIRKILEIGGIIISVIGMVLIILSIVLPLVAGSGLLILGG